MFSRTHSRLFAPRGFGSAQRATLTLFLARLFLSRIFWCSVISSHAWEGSRVPSNVVLSSIGFLVRVVQLKAPAPASFRVSNGNSGLTSLFFFFFLQRKYRLLCVKRYPSTSNAIQTSRLRRESREHWRRSQSCGRERRKIGTELRVARLHERKGGRGEWRKTEKTSTERGKGRDRGRHFGGRLRWKRSLKWLAAVWRTQIINWNSVTQMLRARTRVLCNAFDAFAHEQTTVSGIRSSTSTRLDSIVFIEVN